MIFSALHPQLNQGEQMESFNFAHSLPPWNMGSWHWKHLFLVIPLTPALLNGRTGRSLDSYCSSSSLKRWEKWELGRGSALLKVGGNWWLDYPVILDSNGSIMLKTELDWVTFPHLWIASVNVHPGVLCWERKGHRKFKDITQKVHVRICSFWT